MKYDNWTKAKKADEIIRLKKKRIKLTEKVDRDLQLIEGFSVSIPFTETNTITCREKNCECGRTIRFYEVGGFN